MIIIGIDGGGTSTQATIQVNDITLFHASVASTNYHNVGIVEVENRFRSLLANLTIQAGIDLDQVDGICLGGAGVDSATDQETLTAMFRRLGYSGHLIVVNDAVTALVGGNHSLEGGVIIAGTGSIAYGQLGNKNARAGGWGHLIDDGGSGYDLGIRALKAVMTAYDKRAVETALWPAIQSHLGLKQEDDIIHFLYRPETGKEKIAALAPIVIELAKQDLVARGIVEDAVNQLVLLVQGLSRQLSAESFSLAVAGSLLIKSDYYRETFKSALHNKLPNVELHLPKAGPVEGALIIMKNHLEKEKSHA